MGLHPQVDRGHRLAFNVVVDATGSKVYGTGEWQRRQHRVQRRRTWRTLPLALDTHTQEVIAAALTAATVHDAEVFPALLAPIPAGESIASMAADGAYETRVCHQRLLDRQAAAWIPPRANAVTWPPRADGQTHPRTAILEYRQQHGDKAWKVHSGYHRRSLAETALSRLKTRFGERLSNRRFDTQTTQAYARLAAMNIMTRLGMPDTVVAC